MLAAASLTGCATVAPPTASDASLPTTAEIRARTFTATQSKSPQSSKSPPHAAYAWQGPFADTAERVPGMVSLQRDPARILNDEWPATPDTLLPPTSELASQALGYLGIRYRMGGSSPDTGFDCSGLVGYVTRQVLGLNLPRRAEEISRLGQEVEQAELQPGDLVFYNTLRRKFSHVGIYLGDGRFVHSPSAGGVVRIESMDMSYWKNRFNGARRIASIEAAVR